MDKLNSIKKSLTMNYKSWLLLITALVVISSINGLGNGFATFGVLFVASHLLHYFAHFKNAYPQNIVHLYHHEHNNFFSHLTKSNSWYSFEASLLLSVIDFNVSDEMRWDCLKRLNCQTNKFSDSDLPTAVDALVVDLIV